MSKLAQDPIFAALTRPQMIAGVTYSYAVFNLIVTVEVFLITKSFWALAVAAVVHAGRLCRLRARAALLRAAHHESAAAARACATTASGAATPTCHEPHPTSPAPPRRIASSERSRIGERLPYARHVDDATILTRDGLLMQVLKLDGFPFETAGRRRAELPQDGARDPAARRGAFPAGALSPRRPPPGRAGAERFRRRRRSARRLDDAWRRGSASAAALCQRAVPHPGAAGRCRASAGFIERLFRSPRRARHTLVRGTAPAARHTRDLRRRRLAPYGARTLTAYEAATACAPSLARVPGPAGQRRDAPGAGARRRHRPGAGPSGV